MSLVTRLADRMAERIVGIRNPKVTGTLVGTDGDGQVVVDVMVEGRTVRFTVEEVDGG